MAERVVLHVGTMKSGTSYVQSVLDANRTILPSLGATFPGGFRRQTHAVRSMLRKRGNADATAWHQLVRNAQRSSAPTAIVSMEFLGFANPRQVKTLLEPLAGTEVRVVVTVRDQFRVLPAQWQTFVRNRGSKDWGTYLREIEEAPPREADQRRPSRDYRTFHRTHDVGAAVRRWSVPGVAGIDVVVVPPPDAPREALLELFGRAAGLDVGGLVLDEVAENPSLGYAACDWLRRSNPLLPVGLTRKRYRKLVRAVVRDVLLPLREEQGRPRLDAAGAAFARRRNLELRELLVSGRVDVVGDPEDLPLPDDADLADLAQVAAPPPAEQLWSTARAVHDYAEQRLARRGAAPAGAARVGAESLEELIAATVVALQQTAPGAG